MINSLNGIISYISNDALTLDVQGVGLKFSSINTFWQNTRLAILYVF